MISSKTRISTTIFYLETTTTASKVFVVCSEPGVVVEQPKPAKRLLVSVEDDLVGARVVHADEVVGEALRWVEVEAEHDASSVEHDYLVFFVLP